MFQLKKLSIRSLLLVITILIALPAVGIIIYSGNKLRLEMIDDAKKETQKLADRIASEQQNLIVGAEQLMAALAQLPEVKNQDVARVVPILKELRKLNPMYANISISKLNGHVWASAVPFPPPFVVADRRYFINALATGRLSSGEYIISRAISRPVFNIAAPYKDHNGAVIGVISIGFDIDNFRKVLKSMQLPEGTSYVLSDHQGIVMSRAINPEQFIGKPYPEKEFREMQAGPDSGTSVRLGIARDKRIISYRKLRLAGENEPYMYLTVGIPLAIASREANQILLFNIALFSAFLMIAYAGAWLIGKRFIIDRISLLDSASRRLASGDLQSRVSSLVTGGELGELGMTFDLMAAELSKRDSERKEAEKVLRKSEEQHRTILQTSMDGFWVMDLHGNFLEVNSSVCRMCGYSEQELLTKRLSELEASESPEEIQARFRNIVSLGEDRFESRLRRKDGSLFDIEVSAQYLSIENGRIVAFMRDITRRKQADADLLRKTTDMEQFTYTVSHDLRSPLVTMKTFLGYLEVDMNERNTDRVSQDLQYIHGAADKMKLLLDELLELSRIDRVDAEPVRISLTTVLGEVLDSMAGVITEQHVDIRLPDKELMLYGNRQRLCQIWQNLIENAVKYRRADREICIETGFREVNGETVFYLKDNGIGIEPEYHSKIFGIFEKLNAESSGAGLGLSMIQRIVTKAGGRIWVESDGSGDGSCFYFTLPNAVV